MPLFRQEALNAQKQKLHGDVFLTTPVSFKIITMILIALVMLVLVILFTGSYARIERVPGYLVPAGGLVKIQASRFGTITTMHVREGDIVQSGDVLVSVEAAQLIEGDKSVEQKALQALTEQRQNIQTQIVLEESQLKSDVERIQADIAAAKLEISLLNSQISLQRQITKSSEFDYLAVQKLVEKGALSKVEFQRLQQEFLSQQAQEKLKEQELETTKARFIQLKIQLTQLPSATEGRIARLNAERLTMNAREAELLGQKGYIIKAPVSGRVTSISSNAVGQTVNPQQPILTILPENTHLVAELFVPSRAIGFIEQGQEAKLLYAAFPYQRFGSFSAQIIEVTGTVLSPDEANTPFTLNEPFYRVTAALENDTLEISGNKIALQSGMRLEANIVQEKRSFFAWLLQPVSALQGRS